MSYNNNKYIGTSNVKLRHVMFPGMLPYGLTLQKD